MSHTTHQVEKGINTNERNEEQVLRTVSKVLKEPIPELRLAGGAMFRRNASKLQKMTSVERRAASAARSAETKAAKMAKRKQTSETGSEKYFDSMKTGGRGAVDAVGVTALIATGAVFLGPQILGVSAALAAAFAFLPPLLGTAAYIGAWILIAKFAPIVGPIATWVIKKTYKNLGRHVIKAVIGENRLSKIEDKLTQVNDWVDKKIETYVTKVPILKQGYHLLKKVNKGVTMALNFLTLNWSEASKNVRPPKPAPAEEPKVA